MPNLLHVSLTKQVSIHRPGIPTGDGTLNYLALSSLTSLRISKPYTPLIAHPFSSRSDLALSPILSTRNEPITITLLSPSSHSLTIICYSRRSLPRVSCRHIQLAGSTHDGISQLLFFTHRTLSVPNIHSGVLLWMFSYRQTTFTP